MGAIGGGIVHAYKGAKNSPRGERFVGAMSAVKGRAPITGGSFAVWGGVFSTFDCTFGYVRQKEDPWNAIGAGFMTGGVLAARAGIRASVQSAVIGGTLLALIEGLSIAITRFTAEQYRQVAPPIPEQTQLPPTKLPPIKPGIPVSSKKDEFLPDDYENAMKH